jgi:hypothetical protein
MDTITRFLEHYSYRFPKGYPDLTDPADKKLMQELLSEIGIGEAPETGDFTSKIPKGGNETYYQILKKAGLNDKILSRVETIFNRECEKNTDYLKTMSDNFRSRDIQDTKTTFKIFKDYVDIHDKGLGRGEVAIIMGTIGVTSGGSIQKDIIDSDGNKYDVKELTNEGEFRTASGGYITTTKFKKNLDYLLSLFNQLRGKKENESSNSTQGATHIPEIDKQIDKLLKYYLEGGYKSGGLSGGTIDDVKKLCDDLNTHEFEKGKINIHYIKIAGRKFAVDQETYDKIKNGEDIKNISIGEPISSENSILTKIKEHPWVKNYKLIDDDLAVIWSDYLNKIKGLIIVNPKTLEPTLYTSEELKEKFAPYRIVQNQINVKNKNQIKKDLDEDISDDIEVNDEIDF